MSERLKQLQRLSSLRVAQQRMREAGLARTLEQCLRAERAVISNEVAQAEAAAEKRQALLANRRDHERIAEIKEHIAHQQTHSLHQRYLEAKKASKNSRALLHRATMEAERTATLVENTERMLQSEETRRTQSESDDRFAARTHWQKSEALRFTQATSS